MVDILTGIPSIVAALFIYAVFVTTFGGQRAGWLVSLALVMLMIPVIVRTTEEMLRLVPNELREASYALGVPKWKTIVQDRAADRVHRHHHRHRARHRPGGRRDRAAADPGRLHPGHATATCSAVPGLAAGHDQRPVRQPRQHPRAPAERTQVVTVHYAADRMWGAALTLIIIVMVLNLIARLIGRRSKIAN